jgi:hypothetical protein
MISCTKHHHRRRKTLLILPKRWSWLLAFASSVFALFILVKILAPPGAKVAEYSLLSFYGGRHSASRRFNLKLPARVWSSLNLSFSDSNLLSDDMHNINTNFLMAGNSNPGKSANDGLRDLLNYVNSDASEDQSGF